VDVRVKKKTDREDFSLIYFISWKTYLPSNVYMCGSALTPHELPFHNSFVSWTPICVSNIIYLLTEFEVNMYYVEPEDQTVALDLMPKATVRSEGQLDICWPKRQSTNVLLYLSHYM
jgi:hypothetical protein